MRRYVDVPKHGKKRERSKIDPISINMYEVFANGHGRAERNRGMETEGEIRTLLAVSPLWPSAAITSYASNCAGDREMLSETIVIA